MTEELGVTPKKRNSSTGWRALSRATKSGDRLATLVACSSVMFSARTGAARSPAMAADMATRASRRRTLRLLGVTARGNAGASMTGFADIQTAPCGWDVTDGPVRRWHREGELTTDLDSTAITDADSA
ncbi:hypothetical protein KZX46_13135 [Polymorphobacter sp. PAMC 29334]|nr:hypothetical protein KZX46_13135 [Polymorphobacter sp. PAMC 29334]